MKRRPPQPPQEGDPTLFELTPAQPVIKVAEIERPIWTEQKARFIARYLRYFVFVTHHGTYIDGFAGPQSEEPEQMWAAKLVLENRPRWLRQFFLFDSNREKVGQLRELVAQQAPRRRPEPERRVSVERGDFNTLVRKLFQSGAIGDREAAFCLLDQRTFECRWSTVEALAAHKKSGYKIELFYFLANLWLDRSLKAAHRPATRKRIEQWWGRPDWEKLRDMPQPNRAEAFSARLKDLGYVSVMPWQIFEKRGGRGHIMYYMIHATDHPLAPGLMRRAYENAVKPPEPVEQLALELSPTSQRQ